MWGGFGPRIDAKKSTIMEASMYVGQRSLS